MLCLATGHVLRDLSHVQMYDQWLEKFRTVRDNVPWEQKDARAVGR